MVALVTLNCFTEPLDAPVVAPALEFIPEFVPVAAVLPLADVLASLWFPAAEPVPVFAEEELALSAGCPVT